MNYSNPVCAVLSDLTLSDNECDQEFYLIGWLDRWMVLNYFLHELPLKGLENLEPFQILC